MESRFKLRFCRMFQASFFSCRSRKLSDIIDRAISVPRKHRNFQQIKEPICRTDKSRRTAETFVPSGNLKEALPRRKVSEKFSPFLAPPASPVSPSKVAPLCEFRDCLSREKKKKNSEKIKQSKRKMNKKKKKKKKGTTWREEKRKETNFGGMWWYSSEDDDDTEDETETLFSSRSLTSDSSVSRRRHRKNRARRSSQMGGSFALQGSKVKDSFAVVKNSTNPYSDFRASMVEMIVEKQMFAEKEVEQLFQCFLSLNSRHYHRVITEVYTEIREALFFSDLGFGN